ncbi:hypothetical protein MycrhN_3056 [Mycolicibacterium rhodesiae NBB3]|uniref:Uncharacterized protein n=1 Tax=Mycolicibacterium rhodesiae (strain NBB3) TaxID=710685 RepID=G8RLG4_MYCRN|nr:hypothetical protein [Mycolicibacterium rhodesiae]AEV73596.1 hypothetical protein MycrhN_3056 [Mycolicibacterium rhodesiae NBB3]
MSAPRAAPTGQQPVAPGSATETGYARAEHTPGVSAIPGIVDGWLTASRNANGLVSLRLILGGKQDGRPSGAVIEVVVQPAFAASVAATFAADADAADARGAGDRSSSCVPCRVGISRRLNHGAKSPPG